ncbi:two-component system, NarL family, nitrate/nitrite sensor histidine kinase NarX [Marinobacter daqiaonensis]|uniref:Sensor protein n=1 Tax=Marinobacter daqiaonensis TaxID=650891 RepID=A0A1I6HPR0_9GAMM|nr:histidine kinase [Marinobacter daqiaonensis]SFR56374.1 two-component system, NarL family, nitrate/nitrite sensor histidine kinase NarX [Marinobacter daqiaonensis]
MTTSSPLVRRIAIVVGAIVLTAVVSMATTLAVSQSIEGNATAINQAGALRMGAFELLAGSASIGGEEARSFASQMEDYERRLSQTSLIRTIPSAKDHPLHLQYQTVMEFWSDRLRPVLEAHTEGRPVSLALLDTTKAFVAEVDALVSMLEARTEARIDLLHVIQIISLVFSILIALALFVDLKKRVLQPLRKLVGIATAVGEKDFSRKANLQGADELSRLGAAFDQMTTELALSYHELESEARTKTRELEKSHQALELLHSASRTLFASHDLCSGAIPMLQDLEQLLGVGPIRLYLHDKNSNGPVEAVTTSTLERPFYCRDHHCTACLVTPEVYDELPVEENDGRRLLLPIRTPGQLLGTLEVWYPADKGLSDTARRLLETLSDQLATAIFLEKQITEEQRLTLAEERAVIARELHDSLAQSLSYLKMQVARLRRLEITGEQEKAHNAILEELSTGLNSAYRQLRELLTTFRLKLDTPDLATALRQTVTEFSERLGEDVRLDYDLPPNTLSPNEEIHTLQIVREALANAVKHSQATEVRVQVLFESPKVQVRVLDNGIGLPGGDQPSQHYGLIIIQDRARTLGGKVSVQNRPTGGVEVALSFIPKSRHMILTQQASAG